MSRVIVVALFLGVLTSNQSGAKAMFYNPAGVPISPGPSAVVPGWRQVSWSRAGSPYDPVGIHYWFETTNHRIVSEAVAAAVSEPLTLHIRANTAGYLTIWSTDGPGAEMTPRKDERWPGYPIGSDPFVVPGTVRFVPGEQAAHVIVVFGRSQTEMADSADHARLRLGHLGSRLGQDGRPQIVKESDDKTPGEIGTYVVNREGAPVAAEIVLRSSRTPGR